MATVSVEVAVGRAAADVWAAVADVGAVHRRLLPGRVLDARIDGDNRILTMPDGSQITELIVAVDHDRKRMAYSVVGGQRMPITYHHAAFQVFEDDGGSRLVWTADVLPHGMAGAVQARVERGIVEIKNVLESQEGPAGRTL